MEEKYKILKDLYSKYASFVYYRAYLIIGNKEIAEDVVHDIFFKILEILQKDHELHLNSSWFYRTTTNHCINIIKKRRDSKQVSLEEDYINFLKSDIRPLEDTIAIKELMGSFNEKLSKIAIMTYFDEMTVDEISKELSISKRSIERLQRKIREKLRGKREFV